MSVLKWYFGHDDLYAKAGTTKYCVFMGSHEEWISCYSTPQHSVGDSTAIGESDNLVEMLIACQYHADNNL